MTDKIGELLENEISEIDYDNLTSDLREHYKELSEKDTPDYFTPHDDSHCEAVEKLVLELVSKSQIELSNLEKFILVACVWTHDIGMFTKVATDYLEQYSGGNGYTPESKRELHEEISSWYINHDSSNNSVKTLFTKNNIAENLQRPYLNTISIIIKYHRRKFNIQDCPVYRFIWGERINARLIACLVRLGDTLHIDTSRYDRRIYNILQIGNFDRTSRLHWLKSYLVSSVYLDIERNTILITIDLPASILSEGYEAEEAFKKLKFIVHDDVYEDLLAVLDVFRDYGYRFYNKVGVEINRTPGITGKIQTEIEGILNDLVIIQSPNTSKLIGKSIESIESLCGYPFDNYENFYNQTEQLVNHLKKISSDRPCHVGLQELVGKFESIFSEFPKKESNKGKTEIAAANKKLKTFTEGIKGMREKNIASINIKAPETLKGVSNILLFSYSKMVSEFLSMADNDFKTTAQIYIFENVGKRQHSISDRLDYSDGVNYALTLHAYRFVNITVLPDTSVAALLGDKTKGLNPENSLFLFGANGVDKNSFYCGHTSGHLMMAIVASYFRIPCKVICDSQKIGTINFNSTLERKGLHWLTGQKSLEDELQSKNIRLFNYREDSIDSSLITCLITDDKDIEDEFVCIKKPILVEKDKTPSLPRTQNRRKRKVADPNLKK
ncbi:MAG: hypothetical protein PHD01_05375 [Geobacteraceae bacterium]|nr:hypothetical protein [Geobacteraceae bacterium]